MKTDICVGLMCLITILLIISKIIGAVTISWLWVFGLIWVPVALFISGVTLLTFCLCTAFVINTLINILKK